MSLVYLKLMRDDMYTRVQKVVMSADGELACKALYRNIEERVKRVLTSDRLFCNIGKYAVKCEASENPHNISVDVYLDHIRIDYHEHWYFDFNGGKCIKTRGIWSTITI